MDNADIAEIQTVIFDQFGKSQDFCIIFTRSNRTYSTGGLEKLAREKLARHWKNWPSIGNIGHENLAYFFVGKIGQEKNCRAT